jgi:hypothetical protein
MDSDSARSSGRERASGVLVGRSVTIRRPETEPAHFTALHRARIGQTGRVHAIVASGSRTDPLVKVGFEAGTSIVFFRLSDLDVDAQTEIEKRHHGKRASHLPK